MIHIQEEEGEEGDRGSRRKRLCLEWQVCALDARLLVDWCFGCGGYGRWIWCLGRLYFGWQMDVVLHWRWCFGYHMVWNEFRARLRDQTQCPPPLSTWTTPVRWPEHTQNIVFFRSKLGQFECISIFFQVVTKIASLYAERLMSDLILVVGKQELPAHRLILCASSEVFQVVFPFSICICTSNCPASCAWIS